MFKGLVEDVRLCFDSVELHDRPEIIFGEYAALLDRQDVVSLIDMKAEIALKTGSWRSKRQYLRQEYGVERPEELGPGPVSDLLWEIAMLADYNAVKSHEISPLLPILERHFAHPENCARIMSKKSLLEATLPQIEQEFLSLAQHVIRVVGVDWDFASRLHFLKRPDSLTKQDRELILEFLSNTDSISRDLRRSKMKAFRFIYDESKVETRHPLYATQYALYIPHRKQIVLADPIDQIIVESTKNPSLIRNLRPREFEKFLARIFEGFGYEVELTAATRDGGVDIICLSSRQGIPVNIAIEAKRFDPVNPVTVELVRSFVGANARFQANKLVFVTTSRYTHDAIEYARLPLNVHLLSLKELPDIVKWANEFVECRLPSML